ncbi:MAG: hypothetical protein KF832_11590 [Caldilineaceae bacterium]|nr:hypothetical protein [Caldilineaceae bacterium]
MLMDRPFAQPIRHFAGQQWRWLILLLLLGCVSCLGRDEPPTPTVDRAALLANVATLDVTMHDNYYGDSNTNLNQPPTWTVPSGADVIATFFNQGRRNHNWAVVKPGAVVPVPYEDGQAGNMILHGIGMVYGNSQTTITFNAPEPGDYLVICTVSGHYPEMQGRLRVTAR